MGFDMDGYRPERLNISRFFAFTLDLSLFALPIDCLWMMLAPAHYMRFSLQLMGFSLPLLYSVSVIPLIALALWLKGSTPGKALLGLRVMGSEDTQPSFTTLYKRTLLSYWIGMGAQSQLMVLTLFFSRNRVINTGSAYWDHVCHTRITCKATARLRLAVFIALLAGSYLLRAIAVMSLLPYLLEYLSAAQA